MSTNKNIIESILKNSFAILGYLKKYIFLQVDWINNDRHPTKYKSLSKVFYNFPNIYLIEIF